MHLMPRDAVRPMVRAARAAGFDVAGEESLDLLTRFCESLLPLPPFLVWEADRLENPDAHLIDLDDAPEAPTAQAPATVVGAPDVVSRWVGLARLHRVPRSGLRARAPDGDDFPRSGPF